jgi:hypothetical protein
MRPQTSTSVHLDSPSVKQKKAFQFLKLEGFFNVGRMVLHSCLLNSDLQMLNAY